MAESSTGCTFHTQSSIGKHIPWDVFRAHIGREQHKLHISHPKLWCLNENSTSKEQQEQIA